MSKSTNPHGIDLVSSETEQDVETEVEQLPLFDGVGEINFGAALLGGAAMAVNLGGSFVINFVGSEEYRDVSSAQQISAQYRRYSSSISLSSSARFSPSRSGVRSCSSLCWS